VEEVEAEDVLAWAKLRSLIGHAAHAASPSVFSGPLVQYHTSSLDTHRLPPSEVTEHMD